MPYLSKVMLNPMRPKARRFLTDPQFAKRSILCDFSRQPVDERVLWRLDRRAIPGVDEYQGELLILSASKQSWRGIVETAGYPDCDEGDPVVRDYAPLLALIATGREFAFKVRANPVQNTVNMVRPTSSEAERLGAEGRSRSLRVGHRTVAAQMEWFLKRAQGWGFSVGGEDQPRVRIVERRRLDFVKGSKDAARGKHRVRIGTATFEGILRVTDPAALTSALLRGIGPAKGYGCGLLTLAPVHRGGQG